MRMLYQKKCHRTINVFLFKIVINTLWLVPLRLLLGVLPGAACVALVCAIAIPWGKIKEDQPLRGWRKYVAVIGYIHYKSVSI